MRNGLWRAWARLLGAALLLGAVSPFMEPSATAQDTTLIVEHGRLIIGDGRVLERGSVVISEDRIVAVTEEPVDALATDVRRIDASGRTILPGLIDTHVHLLLEDDDPPVAASDRELARFVERRLPGRLQEYLARGFTTMMSTGDFWPHIREVRDRLSAGELDGPRLMVVGPLFTDPGSHPAYSVCEQGKYRNPWCRRHLAVEVDDPEAARAAVRRLAEGGVDAIKAVYELEPPVTRAIAEEAHRHGLTLYMHPPEDEAAMLPLESWNVDRFVHVPETGSAEVADRVAATMIRHGASASTTLSVYAGDPFLAAGLRGRCDEHLEGGRREALSGVQRTTRALAGTGALAFGTDAPMLPPSQAIECELQLLVDAGLDEEEILATLTSQAAAHIGRASDLGTLEAGKLADVVVVDGDPLSDVLVVRDVDVVITRGEIVVEK